MELQVNKDHYFQERYADLRRFISYYYQIDFIKKTKAKKILFIGVGDGLVPDYLRKIPDIEITTFDIDPALNPDIIGDVRQLPFKKNEFDCVVACEVLEHVPFEYFSQILSQIHGITREWVVLSLPVRQIGFECILRFPFIRKIFNRQFLKILLTIPIKFPGSSHHYWVIDNKQFSIKKICRVIENYFNIIHKENIMFGSNQCFFMLNKKKDAI
jgi:hypothetical protein